MIRWFGINLPFFGQTLPELIATGKHAMFKSLYILAKPFLNADLSSKLFLVPCGKINNILSVSLITLPTSSKI